MMNARLTAFTTLALVTVSPLSARPAMAFDTGPHYDLCQETMSRMGFKGTAIKLAQIQNWCVDFFGATEMEALYGQLTLDMAKLHFDHRPTMDLSSTDKIHNLWTHLARMDLPPSETMS